MGDNRSHTGHVCTWISWKKKGGRGGANAVDHRTEGQWKMLLRQKKCTENFTIPLYKDL